mgnify:CR=1 FL=1
MSDHTFPHIPRRVRCWSSLASLVVGTVLLAIVGKHSDIISHTAGGVIVAVAAGVIGWRVSRQSGDNR